MRRGDDRCWQICAYIIPTISQWVVCVIAAKASNDNMTSSKKDRRWNEFPEKKHNLWKWHTTVIAWKLILVVAFVCAKKSQHDLRKRRSQAGGDIVKKVTLHTSHQVTARKSKTRSHKWRELVCLVHKLIFTTAVTKSHQAKNGTGSEKDCYIRRSQLLVRKTWVILVKQVNYLERKFRISCARRRQWECAWAMIVQGFLL